MKAVDKDVSDGQNLQVIKNETSDDQNKIIKKETFEENGKHY